MIVRGLGRCEVMRHEGPRSYVCGNVTPGCGRICMPCVREVSRRGAERLARTVTPSACCFRRARARYWRLARGYFGLGVALGVAVGMLLGAMSVAR
jgi:hypothetical protein